jgi:xanthine/CO dehydrogenase XdhC/CoxF family maturation factor
MKKSVNVSSPGHTRMHYVTHRSHRMQKHKIGITCLGALSVIFVLVAAEHEKYYVNVLRPGHTGMHYVTHRSHQMQKQKFSITCPGVLFVISVPVPPEHEK